ncbi:MAG: multicopper oxidase domain-containing protein [Pseudomonadota bacterium]
MNTNRRTFMIGSACAATALALPGLAQASARPLPLLPLTDLMDLSGDRIALNLGASSHDFGTGTQSPTYGINSNYLGPVLRVKSGQTLPFDVFNGIENVSTIHWHGLHIPGDVDGGPHQEIAPGETWSPDVPIKQRASMNWFHSHQHGRTASQVYKGMAGIMLLEDDESLSADLPSTYGVDDFTLVLQDKFFNASGALEYSLTASSLEDGFLGDTIVVNGTIAPVAQSVPTGLVRLRIVNASNGNFLSLAMATGPLNVIASDGGFLSATVQTETLVMSPGERYEVLVDMSEVDSNQLMVTYQEAEGTGLMGLIGELFGRGETEIAALTLTRRGEPGFDGAMPDRLANLDVPDRSLATTTRSFELQMDTGADLDAIALLGSDLCGNLTAMHINGKPMDLGRIDETVRKGDTEIWRVTVDDLQHPFHIHGCSFRILSNGDGAVPEYAQGWKDMVHVNDGWSEVLVRFDHDAPANAPYMYHCHILEHEDCGMMGQFTVT